MITHWTVPTSASKSLSMSHRYSWKTQVVVAAYLKKRDGARTHWPNCP